MHVVDTCFGVLANVVCITSKVIHCSCWVLCIWYLIYSCVADWKVILYLQGDIY